MRIGENKIINVGKYLKHKWNGVNYKEIVKH